MQCIPEGSEPVSSLHEERRAGKIILYQNESPALQCEWGSNLEVKHYAAIHHRKYEVQPQGLEMGIITNDLKRRGHSQLHTIKELLQALSNGQNAILSNFEIDINNSIRFVSSSMFAIDIDDDHSVTDPVDTLNSLSDICTGLFYTHSHKVKGNRYRLLFVLDSTITCLEDMEDIIEYTSHYLKKKGLPVDSIAKSPVQIVRGGQSGYIVNDFNITLNTDQWMVKAKEFNAAKREVLKKRQKEVSENLKENLQNPVMFDELKEMCEVIGHIPEGSGEESTQKWLQIVYALKFHVQAGFIDDEQGFELFNIISGGESNEKYWRSIKPVGHVTVGTIIHHAQEMGYKRKHKYGYALQEVQERIETEVIRVKKYIPNDVAIELLERKEKLIVNSPTGSGKTSAFMTAFKSLASSKFDFFIFVAPTIALSEQIAMNHNVTCAKGGIKGLKNMIVRKAIDGERVFVSTYDKAAELISFLQKGIDYEDNPKPSFYLVYDEVHKLTEAYNYRFSTIDQLNELADMATSLIGLTGTPDDLYKKEFDKLIKIENGVRESTNIDYRVFTYDTTENGVTTPENADLMLIPVVRGLLQQTRVLMFINNKERIQRIARLLKREGINVQTVTSDKRQSTTYTNIVEKSTIGEDFQVVISTSILADGVSLNNELNFSCLVVADRDSQLFNVSTIKQMSHRFRNRYRYFALYMRTPNPEYSEERRFNIEAEFQNRLRVVKNHVNYLNDEFTGESLQDFIPSSVEKMNGIFYKATDQDAVIQFNPFSIRYKSMKTKELYYAAYRMAFIKEVGRMIGSKLTGIFNVNDEIRKNGSDLSGLLGEVEAEKEEKKLESAELRDNFSKYFTEEVYENFITRHDEQALADFKELIHPDQYSATLKNTALTDYDTCKKLGAAVKRRADTNKYFNDIRALVEISSFEYVKKTTVTKKIYSALLKLEGREYSSADFKKITEIQLPKKLKVTKKEVKETLKMFHNFNSRSANERLTSIKPLSIEIVADIRHELDQKVIEISLLNYISTRSEQQRKILYASVKNKWNITLESD